MGDANTPTTTATAASVIADLGDAMIEIDSTPEETVDLPVVPDSDSDSEYELDGSSTLENDFTVTKWRNKSSVDQRLRAKEKKRNYQVKVVEDVELTRAAVLKEIPKDTMDSLGPVLAVGSEAVIFKAVASAPYNYYQFQSRKIRAKCSHYIPSVLKIYNKPCKPFLESRREYFENDPEFMELLNKSNVTEFQNIWAKREYDNLVKMHAVSIACPEPLYHKKNIVIMGLDRDPEKVLSQEPHKTLAESVEELKKSDKEFKASFLQTAQTMSDMFEKCGLIHADLNATNILKDGCFIDVAQALHKALPKAFDFLFKDCRNICDFYKSHGLELELCNADSLFEHITGFEYKSEARSKVKSEAEQLSSLEIESRKSERKSQRSVTNSKRGDEA